MRDFWVSCGYQLTDRTDGGGIAVTSSFLKAYLARPELMPPEEACPVERGLHAELLQTPLMTVEPGVLAAIDDADARENFTLFVKFRDFLTAHHSLEQAYLALFSGDAGWMPPLFIQQLTHLIARNAFDGVDDPHILRAAECLFRPQKVTQQEAALLLADKDIIARHEHDRHHSPLMVMLGGAAVSELSVLSDASAEQYWARSDAFDMVFNLTDAAHGRATLGHVATRWIAHLTGVTVAFQPVERLDDVAAAWFIAFDAEAARIGNRVWSGEGLDEALAQRVIALYRFILPDDPRIEARYRGREGFALAAETADHELVLKPQNLAMGLPLAAAMG